MLRTLCACSLAFAILWAAPPCAAADLEEVCAKFNSCYNDGGHDVCWKRQESLLLKKRDAKASRDGSSLHVMTLRGPVIFTDSLDTSVEGRWFRYLGYFPEIRQHLIGVVYYEGQNYVLVSNATASAVFTGDVPHVSPSRKRIAVADADFAYHPNLIKIWTLEESGRLRLEHSEPFRTSDARFVRWEDDASFTVDEYDEEGHQTDCSGSALPYPKLHLTYRWTGKILERNVAKEPNIRCRADR